MLAPSLPMELRFTPGSDRGLASSPFWRRKWELGQAASFGIGERPNYGNPRDADIAPNTYGDVSPLVTKVRRNVIRPGIKLKARFPTFEEKKRDMSWPSSGPGPAKYNTCIPAGQSSWSYPSKNPRWTMGARMILEGDLRESMGKPSPSEYNCITKPGTNSPILRGTLYDIAMKGRTKTAQLGEASPGPARYNVLSKIDKCGLAQKIANVKVPKKTEDGMGNSLVSLQHIQENFEGEAAADEGVGPDEDGDGGDYPGEGSTEAPRTLMRVESSPM